MRSIFIFLLVLNGLFLLWHLAFGGSDSADSASAAQQHAAASYVDAPELKLVETAEAAAPVVGPLDVLAFEPGERCWLIGPFDDETAASDVSTRLTATGLQVLIRRLATPVEPDYLVYALPQTSRAAAVSLLRDLQQRKVDSYIIAEGELENGISLGFYSSEKTAREVLEMHRGQPFQVDIKRIPRQIEEFWGVFHESEYNKLGEEAWSRFRNENGNLSLEQNTCDVVASGNNLE